MKKILFVILFSLFACADTPNKPVTPKELFGWAGVPEDINKKPRDYFYAKFYGKVEILSTKLNAEDYQNKCIQSATKQAKEEILFIALHHTILGGSDIDGIYLDLPIFEKNRKNLFDVKLLNCKSNAYSFHQSAFESGSELRDCECIFYAKVPGGRDAIVARVGMK